MNRIILIGRAGKDPEHRQTENVSVTNFTLAVSEHFKDKSGEKKELTEWFNIVCYSNLSTIAANYIHKGDQVCIEGKIRTRNYTDKDGNKRYVTEVIASNIELLGSKKQEAEPPEGIYQRTGKYDNPEGKPAAQPEDESDLPF